MLLYHIKNNYVLLIENVNKEMLTTDYTPPEDVYVSFPLTFNMNTLRTIFYQLDKLTNYTNTDKLAKMLQLYNKKLNRLTKEVQLSKEERVIPPLLLREIVHYIEQLMYAIIGCVEQDSYLKNEQQVRELKLALTQEIQILFE